METLLGARGAIPSKTVESGMLILIHRLYLPCLNFISGLTDYKRSPNTKLIMFGTYMDYEAVGNEVVPTVGTSLKEVFPNAGRICFTIDHLLENPQHIRNVLAYTVDTC
jgi:hypothetical protein